MKGHFVLNIAFIPPSLMCLNLGAVMYVGKLNCMVFYDQLMQKVH